MTTMEADDVSPYCSTRSSPHHPGVHATGALGDILKRDELEKCTTCRFAFGNPWKRRTFQLHRTGLAYYTDTQDHQKFIPMNDISQVRLGGNSERLEIHLSWVSGSKSAEHRLRADSDEKTKEWFRALLLYVYGMSAPLTE
mmetsp:Transcript_32868/g.83205  ORF Transcript_32868/g.83205 Transcript_32868/m.83205 type:complete len:141 (+) Transcript_32868:48-470(+)